MPARSPEISVSISAKADAFAAAMAKVRKELAGLPALANQAGRRMDLAGGTGGKPVLSLAGLGSLGRSIGGGTGRALAGLETVRSAAGAIPGFGPLAAAATVAGFGAMVSQAASAGVELTNTARLAGTSAAGLNSLRGAARLMGLSAGDADQAMLGLNHTLQDAVYGKNTEALNWFQRQGIDIGSFANGAKSAESVLPKVVETLSDMAKVNPLAAERLAQVWGIPSSALPMMIRGNAALAAQRMEVERIYGSFERFQEASERLTETQAHLGLVTNKLTQDIMVSASPAIEKMLGQLDTFVLEHKDDIAKVIGNISDAITKTDWKVVGDGFQAVGAGISFAATHAKLLETALGVLAANKLIGLFVGGSGAAGALSLGARAAIGAAGLTASLSGDTPGGGSGGPRTPEEMAEMKRKADEINKRHGYTGNFWHDTWQWLTGGGSSSGEQSSPNAPNSQPGQRSPDGGNYKPILDLIGRAEGTDRGRGYNETLAYGKWTGGNVDLTKMTLDQVDAMQTEMLARQVAAGIDPDKASSAAGRYQFTRTTLRDMRAKYGLDGKALFDEANQDRLAGQRIEMEGGATPRNLAQIWASLPDPSTGRSHYGQGTHASLAEVQAAINSSAAASSDRTSGNLQITIDHQNVPAGVTMTPKMQGGGAEVAGINVRRAMPEAGPVLSGGFY